MFMKVLIIDDYVKKAKDIKEAIEYSILEEIEVKYAVNYKEAMKIIINDNIDLISLDWCFPVDENEKSKIGNGKLILDELKAMNLSINTIICSSDQVIINKNNYPFVLGCIKYDYSKNLNSEFSKLIY